MKIMRYDYEIVAERERDTFFFKLTPVTLSFSYDQATLDQHLAWFANWDVAVEKVAYKELLIGDSGYYYVDFRDASDPRLDLWCKTFEDAEGNSLAPDLYQMALYPFQYYLDQKAAGKLEPIDPEDWFNN